MVLYGSKSSVVKTTDKANAFEMWVDSVRHRTSGDDEDLEWLEDVDGPHPGSG